MSEVAKLLHEYGRGAENVVRVSLSEYKGKRFIDIRLYYLDAAGELRPSKSGVTITPELWDEFRAGVAAAEAALQEAHLWYPPGVAA